MNIEKLVSMLESPKADTRYDACELLRVAPQISDEAIAALEKALDDPDRHVRESAESALRVHKSSMQSQDIVVSGEANAAEGTMMKDSKSLWQALELWVIWNLATDVSLALVWPIMLFAYIYLSMGRGGNRALEFFQVGALAGLLGGMVMGLCQWAVLAERINRARRWILATALGWAIWICGSSLALEGVGSDDFLTAGFVVLAAAVGGGIVGLAQWIVFRREVPGAGWWVLASVVGWAGAGLAVMAMANTGLVLWQGVVAGLTIMGMVTGIAFVFFFEQASQRRLSVVFISGLTLALILGARLLVTGIYSQEKFTLRGHTYQVYAVAFSPDGKVLASGSYDNTVKLWDVTRGKDIRTLGESIADYDAAVKSIAFSPDETLLAAGLQDGTVKLWDVAHGQQVRAWRAHTDQGFGVESVDFSPDGKLLASGGDDDIVRLWDIASGQEVHVLRGHMGEVYSVAFSSDGTLLVSGGGWSDSTVRIWDVTTGQELQTLQGDSGAIMSVAFSPDGRLVASGGWVYDNAEPEDRGIILWDVTSGKRVRAFGRQSDDVNSIAFSLDGTLLAVGYGGDGSIRLWEVATGKEVSVLRGHSDSVMSVAFSPDGTLLASGSYDHTGRLWDVSGER